ncbi:hypothetical protein FHU37_003000 [Allostreptomyces psammosilenae]|uniref:Uncharacterized protein n=1 Tax=Allostreptomyces psammosilenae TaxID=1892865 RepID=A0A852ZWJ7_9ACTN|nr:hypothetical protein [Allostreptomyces psammosilenae]
MRTCIHCGCKRAIEEFVPSQSKTGTGITNVCRPCYRKRHAEYERRRREQLSPEVRRDNIAAYRAGIRVGKCAVCRTTIPDKGLCEACKGAIRTLGGTEEALQRAKKVLRYLGEV